jgi:dTDP-4-amino-4,6-dideoxygalactose transaminase
MKAAGVQLRYYPIKRNLDADLAALADLCDQRPKPIALYLTHFIGWPQPVKEIQALCREKHLILIEDCALSFLSECEGRPLGTFGAYSVFCLYKTLPIPNGGVLVANSGFNMDELSVKACSLISMTGPSIDLLLRWFRSYNNRFGRTLSSAKTVAGRTLTAVKIRRVPVGGTGFDASTVNVGMSPICHALLRRFEYDAIKECRRRNFKIVDERLRGKVALLDKTLSDGVCPLFFPLLVKDKKSAAGALAQRGIETIEFWNQGDPKSYRPGSAAEFLRLHLLELPIHQDLTPDAAEYAAEQILKCDIVFAA